MARFGEEDRGEATLLASLVNAIVDPLIVLDRSVAVVAFNAAARQAWPNLAEGRPLSFALRAPDVLQAIDRVLRGERRVHGVHGERVPVERVHEFTASGLDGPADRRNAPAVAIVFRDLTEARRLDLMRVDFVANASHELRTPLASVLGFIETLEGPARNDATVRDRFLAIMREQAQRMARLVDDLLSLSRVEMNEHRPPDGAVDLSAVVRQIVDTLRPMARERDVSVETHGAEAALMVAGDRDELLRVAENLVENAIKYGQDGKRVEIVVDVIEEPGARRQARLSVRDYGPGIAPEHLPRLTERFYRIDTGASRDKGGTGLGLAIVKHIVNRHGGRLAIESRPGEGATFRILIPLLPPVHDV